MLGEDGLDLETIISSPFEFTFMKASSFRKTGQHVEKKRIQNK
jgi:hypothetical protein